MNPNCIASNFSVQQVSKHHYLIRGDERVKDYMNFCDVKWSNTYQGWIVHEDDEVDLIQMHMEVMDLAKNQKARADKKKAKKAPKKSSKKQEKPNKKASKKKLILSSDEESQDESEDEKPKKTKKRSGKKGDVYERFKRGEDISDDEEDEYVPSSEPTSETITEESDLEEDSDDESEEEESEEDEEDESEEESDEEESEEEEDEECETDPKRKKEFQFYKKGVLAFGKMTDRQQEKLEAIWNKTLRGWIIRMSNLEKLKKQGWTEIGHEEPEKTKLEQNKPHVKKLKEKVIDDTTSVVNTPKVTKKPKTEEKKTIEKHLFSLLVKGPLTLEQVAKLQAIYHPTLKGFLVSLDRRDMLLEMGFTENNTADPIVKETKDKEVVKIDFTQGEQLIA